MPEDAQPATAIQAVLNEHLTADAEWKAYFARITRILLKRNEGLKLTNDEEGALADYKIAAHLTELPKDKRGNPAPPIFYSYREVESVFEWDVKTLMNARASGCPAFSGKMIFTATLLQWFRDHPSGPWKKHNHTGRVTKCTPKIIKDLCEALKKCPHLQTAALAVGLSRHSLYEWKKRGENGEQPFARFLEEVERTIAERQIELVQDIATDPDWRAKLAILERLDRSTFARRMEHTGADGADLNNGAVPIHINLTGVTANPYEPKEPE